MTSTGDAMASSQIVQVTALVIAPVIVQEIAPVIALAIAPAIVREIAPPESATAVQIRVMSEGQAQAHVMSAAVDEIRTSAVMSAAAAVISAAVEPAPARQIVAAAVATMVVAVATMDQAARRLAVAPVRKRAAAATVARPAWRVRVVAAEELVPAVGAVVVEVGDDG